MLTIFAIPRAFEGHFGLIQRNAIRSWIALEPRPEILLFGDEWGTAEVCLEMGLRHIPGINRTTYGAPLLSDLFQKAAINSRNPLLCYINADILLLPDFLVALQEASRRLQKFLLVARRWDTFIGHPVTFEADTETSALREQVAKNGRQAPLPGNSDFFAFPRGLWSDIPALGVGRGAWDAWLVYEARRRGAAVVDASSAVMAIHQSHDQSAYPHGLRRWRAELDQNYEIAGKDASSFCLYDATHIFTPSGLQRPLGLHYFARRIDTLPIFYPSWRLPMQIPRSLIAAARGIHNKKTQLRDPLDRLKSLVHSKLPKSGITSILGLLDSNNPNDSPGLQLAHSLIWGGCPVVVYDPRLQAMERAREVLGGPVRFAKSVDDCVDDSDVVVIAAACPEFKKLPAYFASTGLKRQVIDGCNLFRDDVSVQGLQYARC
jgi:hypothetical protein